jgi:hypothetical protein
MMPGMKCLVLGYSQCAKNHGPDPSFCLYSKILHQATHVVQGILCVLTRISDTHILETFVLMVPIREDVVDQLVFSAP